MGLAKVTERGKAMLLRDINKMQESSMQDEDGEQLSTEQEGGH